MIDMDKAIAKPPHRIIQTLPLNPLHAEPYGFKVKIYGSISMDLFDRNPR
jgi:hypothetical protein